MISFEEIKKHYSNTENKNPGAILKEYLQYKILQIIFQSEFGNKLIFMGGTSIRIIYGSDRFSEDLDLDNFGLTKKDFSKLMNIIKLKLAQEGIIAEIREVFKGVYRCYLKFPKILYHNKLSSPPDEKILIQIDSYSLNKQPKFIPSIISKADVFGEINAYPASIILAQKIFALFNGKRAKGRDIYDIIYLFSLTEPDWKFLNKHLKIKNYKDLYIKLSALFSDKELSALAADVEPFLIDPKKSNNIKLFNKWIKQKLNDSLKS